MDMLSVTGELLERTSDTLRVQQILQLSLAPVFLLAAIGAMLNVMNTRLGWLIDRIEWIERRMARGEVGCEAEELPALEQRQHLASLSVNLSTAAAFAICMVVVVLFTSAFIEPRIGTFVAFLWITTMVLLSAALAVFFRETRLATANARERRKRGRAIKAQEREKADHSAE